MMRIRRRLDGTPLQAELDLRHSSVTRSQYVLQLRDHHGRQVAVGHVTAAIGYEIIEVTREELTALALAGFNLPRAADNRAAKLSRLVGVLRQEKKVATAPLARKTSNTMAQQHSTHPSSAAKVERPIGHRKEHHSTLVRFRPKRAATDAAAERALVSRHLPEAAR